VTRDEPAPPPRETVTAGYERLVDDFAEWASRVDDPGRDTLFDEFIGRLPQRASILDVGCGSGAAWARDLATRFAVTGIDISPAQVDAARRNVPSARFLVADVTAIEFEPASFDGVLALYSVGHLPAHEHEDVFGRFGRWLRPGGVLLASLPAEADRGSTRDWIGGVPMFFASLGAARYVELLHKHGWHVIEAETRVADEPDGRVSFLWILAQPPGQG